MCCIYCMFTEFIWGRFCFCNYMFICPPYCWENLGWLLICGSMTWEHMVIGLFSDFRTFTRPLRWDIDNTYNVQKSAISCSGVKR